MKQEVRLPFIGLVTALGCTDINSLVHNPESYTGLSVPHKHDTQGGAVRFSQAIVNIKECRDYTKTTSTCPAALPHVWGSPPPRVFS
jgi:hypothetical protein